MKFIGSSSAVAPVTSTRNTSNSSNSSGSVAIVVWVLLGNGDDGVAGKRSSSDDREVGGDLW